MDHDLDIEKKVRSGLLQLSKDLDMPSSRPTTCTTPTREDADAHEVLLCVAVR